MARARNIKPAFFQNEDLVELPYEVRLLFIGLWTIADREGRLENRPKKIKMQIFPADDLDITRACLSLAEKKLVSLYTIDNVDYIQIVNFLKHQHPHHKEVESTIPPEVRQVPALGKTGANPSDSLNPITDSLNPITLASVPESRAVEENPYPNDLNFQAWTEYVAYRKEAKIKKLTGSGEKKSIKKLISFGDYQIQQHCVDETIANGWTGIFEPKTKTGGSHGRTLTAIEQVELANR